MGYEFESVSQEEQQTKQRFEEIINDTELCDLTEEERLKLRRQIRNQWNKVTSTKKGTEDGSWFIIKYNDYKSNPFGTWDDPQTNTWDHERSSQFQSYSRKEGGFRSEISDPEYWKNVLIPLLKKECPDWETNETVLNSLRQMYDMVEYLEEEGY